MPKINILSPEIAQLIAAGEVVDRPGSVIKEMVENSIDAGATRITVEIKNGGNSFLRVTDNGCGISREDCPAAFMPHATSKIKTEADLDSIGTLGFRGEALASVASVSRVEMLTKTAEEENGTRLIIEGGEITDIDDAGCPVGTVITVRDLFYNTPARRKFLKKDMTEAANIGQIMDRIALSHPEISFTLKRESGDALYTPGDGNLMSAVSAVLGKEVAESMLTVDSTSGAIRVVGCTCKPISSRPNRNMQIFFLNGRFIRSKTFVAAIEQAYKDSIMVNKFPACVLNVSLPFDLADVNVHPAKMEVRFADEQTVFRAVYYSIKAALESNSAVAQGKIERLSVTRPAEFADEKTVQGRLEAEPPHIPFQRQGGFYSVDLSAGRAPEAKTYELPREAVVNTEITYNINQTEQALKPAPEGKIQTEAEQISCRYIGEAFDTYIIAEVNDSIYFVDKHALHERLLFEEIKKKRDDFSQQLLTPMQVNLTKNEYAAILENIDGLKKAGFDISDFGDGTLLVRAMPMYYETADIADSLTEIAGKLLDGKNATDTDKTEWLFRSVACRGAIKAGAKSSKEELMRLLSSIIEIRYCPHGRPVTLELTRQRIEKEFHRQ